MHKGDVLQPPWTNTKPVWLETLFGSVSNFFSPVSIQHEAISQSPIGRELLMLFLFNYEHLELQRQSTSPASLF